MVPGARAVNGITTNSLLMLHDLNDPGREAYERLEAQARQAPPARGTQQERPRLDRERVHGEPALLQKPETQTVSMKHDLMELSQRTCKQPATHATLHAPPPGAPASECIASTGKLAPKCLNGASNWQMAQWKVSISLGSPQQSKRSVILRRMLRSYGNEIAATLDSQYSLRWSVAMAC